MKNNMKNILLTQKLADLQIEANAIAQRYNWPKEAIPAFTVIYCTRATGAFINLDTQVITLTSKHLNLPISYVRFTLAHEIAHYYQEVTGFTVTTLQAISHRKYMSALTLLGFMFAAQQSFVMLACNTNIFDMIIASSILLGYMVLSTLFMQEVITKAKSQLIELNADTHAIAVLNDTEAILSYLKMNQVSDYLGYSNNIVGLLIKKYYSFLFSTHPTDAHRMHNAHKFS